MTGIILILTGFVLRYMAYKKLGSDFTLTLERPKRVVTTGIYKYLKHPSYWGSLLIILGCSLIDETLGILAISWAFYKSRMVEEEKILKRS